MAGSRFIAAGEHFYQPPRQASHQALRDVSTDPEGKDWTAIIAQQCYVPQSERGTLQLTSFDMLAALRRELAHLSPESYQRVQEAMRTHGVGDSFIHPLLPDLSDRDKSIVVGAGRRAFERESGVSPQWFWPPETALDTPTLEVLAEQGYTGVICAPEQLFLVDGTQPDCQLVTIQLPSGRSILAYPFDRPISSALAFDPKHNAEDFARAFIEPRNNWLPNDRAIVTWTDAETFGHHYPFRDLFWHQLLMNTLRDMGLSLVSINDIAELSPRAIPAKLVERSAWSCPHGNLIRWNGECACSHHDARWKAPFAHAFRQFNTGITTVLDTYLSPSWPEYLSETFSDALYNTGGRGSSGVDSLLSAKASALTALTSCATFFDEWGTSGMINILHAQQALHHLCDAGLTNDAETLQRDLHTALADISDSHLTAYLSQLSTR